MPSAFSQNDLFPINILFCRCFNASLLKMHMSLNHLDGMHLTVWSFYPHTSGLVCPLWVLMMFSLPGMSDYHHCWILWSWDVFLKWTMSFKILRLFLLKNLFCSDLKHTWSCTETSCWLKLSDDWLKRHASFIFNTNVVYHIIVSVSNPQSVYYDMWDRVFNRPSIVQMNSDYAAVAPLTEMQCHMTYWFYKVLIIQESTSRDITCGDGATGDVYGRFPKW